MEAPGSLFSAALPVVLHSAAAAGLVCSTGSRDRLVLLLSHAATPYCTCRVPGPPTGALDACGSAIGPFRRTSMRLACLKCTTKYVNPQTGRWSACSEHCYLGHLALLDPRLQTAGWLGLCLASTAVLCTSHCRYVRRQTGVSCATARRACGEVPSLPPPPLACRLLVCHQPSQPSVKRSLHVIWSHRGAHPALHNN